MGKLEKLRLASSLKDLKKGRFWAALVAECVGALLFLLLGVGSVLLNRAAPPSNLHIAFGFGIALATAIWCTADVSGGHINPAVSVSMLLMRKISLIRCILYIGVQCIGAIVGVAILKGLTNEKFYGSFGTTKVSATLTVGQGVGVEIMMTFTLVLTVFACCDKHRHDLNSGCVPLAIGLAVFVGHTFGINYTGASMNPARSIGSAAISGNWEYHWVYWIGPIIGASFAALIYDLVLAGDASLKKALAWLLAAEYDGELPPEPKTVYTDEHGSKLDEVTGTKIPMIRPKDR